MQHMSYIYFGSFVGAALKAKTHPIDPNLARINQDIPDLFTLNGLTEGRTWKWKGVFKSLLA